jgi:signal transduction histidine kinase
MSALDRWLAEHGGEAGARLVAALRGRAASIDGQGLPDGADGGEATLPGGRVVSWREVRVGGDGSRVYAFQDVTPARQVASALRDAGNLLRILEAHSQGVVLELDADARIVGIWAAGGSFFEKTDAMLQGQGLRGAIGEAEGATLDALVRRVFATGDPETFEYAMELRGERRVFSANALLMPSDEDEPPRVTVMIRDVTERTRMQTQLLEAERLLSMGVLAAGVAHEVNNPLAYILLNLERIQVGLRELGRQQPPEAIAPLLDAVRISLEGGRRVQTIVRDLTHFSRSGDHTSHVPVDVRRVLDFVLEMAGPETRARATVVREFGNVPYVLASESRLSQIFLNLIVNAAQAINRGTAAENEIRVVTMTDDCGRAVVEIRDTGEGMPESVMQRIFEPFYTTKMPGSGTGLGLAVCQRIATSLGGRLEVESQVGRGSSFRLVLPAADDARVSARVRT